MVYKKPSDFIGALVVAASIVAVFILLLSMKLMNDKWKDYCEDELGGRLTSSQQMCLSDDGRVLDARN
jgi:hypothetical protein